MLLNLHDHAQLGSSSSAEKAASQLSIGAFFFAMRSCEYSHVSGSRRTKPLRLRNLRFFKQNRLLPHSDPALATADALSITFEFQKTDVRHETVHQHATGFDILCPVVQWAAVVQRVLGYPGCDSDSLVSTVLLRDKLKLVTGTFVGQLLKAAAKRLGEDVLGFSHSDVGTHSLRSGAAMAMYLAGVPVFTIMLIGRWSSDAFLRYIRRQVLQFSAGVSKRMVGPSAHNVFTVPDIDRDIDAEHPRTRAHRTNFHSPTHHGSRQKPSTPDHVFESLLPRFELSI
jgi:hypothetical protein